MTDERSPHNKPPQWIPDDDPLLEDFPRFTEEELESSQSKAVEEQADGQFAGAPDEYASWRSSAARTFEPQPQDVEFPTSDAFVDIMMETHPDANDAPEMGLGGRILAFLGLNPGGVERERLYNLNHAIQVAPDAAVNYVLRGEIYMDRGEYRLAADDFRQALELAESQFIHQAEKQLGIINQAMQDRALAGYESALRRIKPNKRNRRDFSEDI